VVEAALWALFGQTSLVLGALVAIRFDVPKRALGLVAGFGAGTLVAAAAFELSVPAFRAAGARTTGVWLAIGAVTFYGADRIMARRAGDDPDHASVGIALGALLDGVPESVAIAISTIGGSSVSGAMVLAVLFSNLPEGMASTPGFVRRGWSTGRTLRLWLAIAAAGAVAAAIGHALLADASGGVIGGIQAFAAGTILTMIAAVMLPAAYEDGREAVGLSFVLGFAVLAFLTSLGS
jgi:ZIP family zinc transporter